MATEANDNEELARLLMAFSSGDVHDRRVKQAQQEFYARMCGPLNWHMMSKLGNNAELAQVAMQKAWMKIFNSAHTYDARRSRVHHWTRMIVEQCAVDELRKFYGDQGKIVNLDDEQGDSLDGFACALPGPEERLYARQLERATAECVERLPAGTPNYRLTMTLLLEQALTYEEMRDILACQSAQHSTLNAEQVRGWARHARARMQACLGEKLGWTGKGGTR